MAARSRSSIVTPAARRRAVPRRRRGTDATRSSDGRRGAARRGRASAASAVPQLGGEVVGSAEGPETAVVEHRHPVGDTTGLAEEVGGQQDGASVLAGERADQVGDVAGGGRVEARRRFVEEEDLGVVQQGRGRARAACVGRSRSPSVWSSALSPMANRSSMLVDPAARPRRGSMPRTRAVNIEVLAGGQPVVEAGVLGQHAGAAADGVAVGDRIEPEHPGLCRGPASGRR